MINAEERLSVRVPSGHSVRCCNRTEDREEAGRTAEFAQRRRHGAIQPHITISSHHSHSNAAAQHSTIPKRTQTEYACPSRMLAMACALMHTPT